MIIALHGAAPASLMFCSEGTQVLEIFPPCWSPLYYYELGKVVSCKYYLFAAFPAGPCSRSYGSGALVCSRYHSSSMVRRDGSVPWSGVNPEACVLI